MTLAEKLHAIALAAFAALLVATCAHAQEIVFKGSARNDNGTNGVVVCAPGYACGCDDLSCTVCKAPNLTSRTKNGYMQVWVGCDGGWRYVRDEHGKRVKP